MWVCAGFPFTSPVYRSQSPFFVPTDLARHVRPQPARSRPLTATDGRFRLLPSAARTLLTPAPRGASLALFPPPLPSLLTALTGAPAPRPPGQQPPPEPPPPALPPWSPALLRPPAPSSCPAAAPWSATPSPARRVGRRPPMRKVPAAISEPRRAPRFPSRPPSRLRAPRTFFRSPRPQTLPSAHEAQQPHSSAERLQPCSAEKSPGMYLCEKCPPS